MLMTIFDKSFIHGISVEEAAVFDMHFMTNLTPMFFVEVLADLEKSGMDEAARAGLVRDLAGKTPRMHSYPNIPHGQLAISNLIGQEIEMRGAPMVGGARAVQSEHGRGTIFDHPPEMEAASRWQKGIFGPEEYASAREWRAMLDRAPDSVKEFLGESTNRFTFRDLEAVKCYAERVLDRDGNRYRTLKVAMVSLGVPTSYHATIVQRWKAAGGPSLADFAPYSRYVLIIDIFRTLAMASGLMSHEKKSNFADVAYLYYLPFCQLFVSNDKLHKKCVPLFISDKQQFVWGHDLRPHLKELVDEYLNSSVIENIGLYKLSRQKVFPPDSFIGGLISKGPRGQRPERSASSVAPSVDAQKELADMINKFAKSPSAEGDGKPAEEGVHTMFKRSVMSKQGRLNIFPSGHKTSRELD